MDWLIGGALVPVLVCGGMCIATAAAAAIAARRQKPAPTTAEERARERVPTAT